MLTPQQNNFRDKNDISGIWKFAADPQKTGEKENWNVKFNNAIKIAVPGSWNEQLEAEGLMHYVGNAWYATDFFIPKYFDNKRIWIRIGSADYYSKLWINEKFVGDNLGGFLPIDFEITSFVKTGENNKLTLLINNELNSDTIPQGISSDEYGEENRRREETFPAARFDFSPYGGIHRPVYIYTTPIQFIKDVSVSTYVMSSVKGKIKLKIDIENSSANQIRLYITGNGATIIKDFSLEGSSFENEFELNECRLWSCDDPYLYKLKIELLEDENCLDEYSLKIGIREVKIDGFNLLLNNEPVFLKGFGKHEDFPVIGKALNLPLLIKDFSLMKWINANSFRTSHYPYAEEWLDFADENGFLVVNEVPAVSLDFRKTNEKTLKNHKDFIKKLIGRDKNHPSVIMWAPGNEPNLVGEESYYNGSGDKYWKEICEYTKQLDPSRPVTIPNCQRAGKDDPVFIHSDVVSLNRYYGWYENPGLLDTAIKRFEEEMDYIADKYKKPIFITEFGADTMPGFHSISDQMFTEEYQSEFLKKYCELIESKDYTIGEHVWNFADFKTPQHFRRVVLNLKGIFNRTRDPKLAAFTLKKIWGK
ncbi:MAG: beta-glucuronidase [Bacteroidetes bacterium]|nr:beta-glucuronidase [Bacteroidota bacterium]